MKDLKAFIQDVSENSALTEKLNELAKNQLEQQVAAVVKLAKENGYDFSEDDFYGYIEQEKGAEVTNDNRCYTLWQHCYVLLT